MTIPSIEYNYDWELFFKRMLVLAIAQSMAHQNGNTPDDTITAAATFVNDYWSDIEGRLP